MSESKSSGPQIIQHFIGQPQIVAQVRVALEATWGSGEPLGHTLLVGPSGVGKTELSHLIAKELGTELRETLGQNLHKPSHVAGFLMQAGHHDVLFIDEIHELSRAGQTVLYRALVEGRLFVNEGPFAGENMCKQLPPFTLLAATTHESMLAKPLRDRFEMILRFGFYSPEELSQIVRRSGPFGRDAEEGVAELIAQRSKGIPRLALRLLRAVRRVALSEGAPRLTTLHFQRACELEGVDELGLDPTERSYLSLLSAASNPVPPSVLAAQLDLPLKTIQEVVEPFLIRVSLIERTSRGRLLTEKGRQHLARKQPPTVPVI